MSDDNYLVGLDLTDKRVVIVGGGSVAQRRLGLLARAGARIEVITIAATPAVESFPGITVTLRPYRTGDLADAWYAIVATDDPAVNAQVVADATAARIFCVRADAGRDGTAVTPATFRHDDLTVGVLASGNHRRSAAVRNQLAAALGDDELATSAPKPTGVALVGGGPGDADLITVRGRRLLRQADVVIADRLGPVELLAELGPGVEIIDAAKVPYGRAMAQQEIERLLVERARAGKFVVRLKGGDPFVFGRGYEEVQACVAAGIPVTVTPGLSSSLSGPAAAGIPVTHRGVTHEFVVVSGHVPPGHPDSLVDWEAVGRLRGTVVIMMGVARVAEFAAALLAAGRPADTPVAFVENATTPRQRVIRATLGTAAAAAAEAAITPPALIVVGAVAGLSAVN